MSYQRHNKAKANFTDVYHATTPHQYFKLMNRLDYRIGEEAEPYIRAVVELLRRQNPRQRLHMLDLGCSYGVGAALVKYQFSFDQIVAFFAEEASRDYAQCVRETRQWLQNEVDDPLPIKCVGVDCSEEAVHFAEDSDLIDAGITKNFEADEQATEQDYQLIRHCQLMTSTGAIGYVTDKTLAVILSQLGKFSAEERGPYVIVTILRMFDTEPIRRTFAAHGFQFARLPGINLRQRFFADEGEQSKTVRLVEERGLDPGGLESEGLLYADLYAAAPKADYPELVSTLRDTHRRLVNAKDSALEN